MHKRIYFLIHLVLETFNLQSILYYLIKRIFYNLYHNQNNTFNTFITISIQNINNTTYSLNNNQRKTINFPFPFQSIWNKSYYITKSLSPSSPPLSPILHHCHFSTSQTTSPVSWLYNRDQPHLASFGQSHTHARVTRRKKENLCSSCET